VIELFTGLGFMAGPPIGGLLYQVRFTTVDFFFLSLRKEGQNGQKTFV